MALSRVNGKENLFVSGIFAFRRPSLLEEHNIAHVLSVIKYDLTAVAGFEDTKIAHLSVDIDDVEESDILIHLPKLVRFIESGLYGDAASGSTREPTGSVLVHCAMGKSRSVTAVVAYLLWKHPHRFGASERRDPESATSAVKRALEWIRESRSLAEPNDGFMKQLELWWEMGCPAEGDDAVEKNRVYRRWAYRREVEEAAKLGMAPERLLFEDEEKQVGEKAAVGEPGLELRCKKCRRVLATKPFIVPHRETGPPQTACPHFFIEPLSWMRPTLEEGVLEGRLNCPGQRCGASIGRYSWQGFKCSCAEWVCPAFSLQRSRVDEVATAPPRGLAGRAAAGDEASRMAALGIRLPPGRAGPPAKENL
jgi:dual specificity phosphatase 12